MLDLLISDAPSSRLVKDSLEGFAHRVQRALYRWGVPSAGYDNTLHGKAYTHALTLLRSYQEPSCFKAAAALTLGLVSAKPFEVELPTAFGVLRDKPNAVFGILESVYWMHGAELRTKTKGEVKVLTHQIEFSDHFFEEFVTVSDKIGWPSPLPATEFSSSYHWQFRTLALTFEALAYQKNSHCKYSPPHELELDKYYSTLA